MARQPRAVFAGLPHLLALRVQHQQTLAVDDQDRNHALATLSEAMHAHGISLHAYGLTQALVELVVTPSSAESLSRAMQAFARRHAAAFNRRHGRHGALWSGRFSAAALEADPWLLRAMVRVEQMATQSASACSSAAHHVGLGADRLISEPAAFWQLGNTPFDREAIYRQRLGERAPPEWAAAMDAALRSGRPLGSAAFLARLAAQTGRSFEPQARGRPRKEVIRN